MMMLTLYSKPGCHLCEDLRSLLDELQAEYGYTIEEIDITSSDTLFQQYRYEIPVLVSNGRELGKGKLDEQDLRDALAQLVNGPG